MSLKNNTQSLQEVLEILSTKASGGEQATPEILVNSSTGLVTATAGSKTTTYQMAFQAAKTITPSTVTQVAISSGHYAGGSVTVAAVPTQSKSVTPTSSAQNIVPDNGKFLSKVTVNSIPSSYVQPTSTKAAATYTPTTANQTIAAGTYLTGAQTIKGDSNLVASNIKSGISIFGVNGTLQEGSGSGEASEWSENEDAMVTGTLSVYNNDRVESVRDYAFYNYSNLTSVNFSLCTSIGSHAFQYCSKLTSVNFPVCTLIEYAAFCDCSNLTSVSFPLCTTIGGNAFYNCSNLTSVNSPDCTSIGNNAFQGCHGLTSVSFPLCTTIGGNAFYKCSNLTSIYFPLATSIDMYAFTYCSKLTSVNFPVCTLIETFVFSGCRTLSSFQLGASSVCTLSNSNAFSSTPFAGYSAYFSGTPHIYVPGSLAGAYRSATNWTYFSKYIVPDGNYLESVQNQYILLNTTKNISAEIYFIDDNENKVSPTVTVTSSDESIVNISNVQVTIDQITFDIVTNNAIGKVDITIVATYAGKTLTRIFTVNAVETMPEPTYTVESLAATYTFALNSNNYYESNNKGKDNSFAICKVNIDAIEDCTMYLDCINYAENNYDYGILSNLDSTLTLSSSADTASVYKSFKGLSSSNIQTISYEVPGGQHYIYVKYIKDDSAASDNDSFQFSIRFE